MKKFIVCLFLTSCTAAQLKEANNVYETIHAVRTSIEAIPGVTAVVDAYLPSMTGIRIGLNETYEIKHTLLSSDDMMTMSSLSSVTNTVQ